MHSKSEAVYEACNSASSDSTIERDHSDPPQADRVLATADWGARPDRGNSRQQSARVPPGSAGTITNASRAVPALLARVADEQARNLEPQRLGIGVAVRGRSLLCARGAERDDDQRRREGQAQKRSAQSPA